MPDIKNVLELAKFTQENPSWRYCQCCWDDCDCGCIESCPIHKLKTVPANKKNRIIKD